MITEHRVDMDWRVWQILIWNVLELQFSSLLLKFHNRTCVIKTFWNIRKWLKTVLVNYFKLHLTETNMRKRFILYLYFCQTTMWKAEQVYICGKTQVCGSLHCSMASTTAQRCFLAPCRGQSAWNWSWMLLNYSD